LKYNVKKSKRKSKMKRREYGEELSKPEETGKIGASGLAYAINFLWVIRVKFSFIRKGTIKNRQGEVIMANKKLSL
jgi:hypothetical protein